MLSLGVLDQLPAFVGRGPAQAARDSLALAAAVEELGYTRFWVAEHHGDPSRACAAPEVLAAAAAARTRTLRVGAGCVLLQHTSPLRVAEAYRLLSALAPGRVELGIGRAVGATPQAAALLALGASAAAVDYPDRVAQVLDLLGRRPGGLADDGLLAVPADCASPEVWLMGSGPAGAQLAAALGLPLGFAQFAHPVPRPDVVQLYRESFRPSATCPTPKVALAVRVACAETPREARLLSYCVWMPALAAGGDPAERPGAAGHWWSAALYPSLQDAADYRPSTRELYLMEAGSDLVVTGDPAAVHRRLGELATDYAADELVLITTCPDVHARLRMHQLLAEESAAAETSADTPAARTPPGAAN